MLRVFILSSFLAFVRNGSRGEARVRVRLFHNTNSRTNKAILGVILYRKKGDEYMSWCKFTVKHIISKHVNVRFLLDKNFFTKIKFFC